MFYVATRREFKLLSLIGTDNRTYKPRIPEFRNGIEQAQ